MGRARVPPQVLLLMAGVLGFAVVVLGYGLWDRGQRGPIVISTDPTLAIVVVEVRGAVVRPGLYTLPEAGRVGQLIELAGGATGDADMRQVNLARRLTDEELVIIPSMRSAFSATPVGSPSGADADPSGDEARLNVNTASAADLEALPGIGEVLAARIVAYRHASGPFQRVDDLALVEGISDGLVDDLRELIVVAP